MSKQTDARIIVALDYAEQRLALEFASKVDPRRCRLKVGKELFTRNGPAVIEALHRQGFDVFLDLKFHDIPNTVAGACRVAAGLGVWMLNVHALGGRQMMQAAREAIDAAAHRPLLIAVTVLTSMGEKDIHEVGLSGEPADHVGRLAMLARDSGMDGVVCSPQEVAMLRERTGEAFLLVTPGIRPLWSVRGDQARVTTPEDAIRLGSSYLVIGRPITAAADPMQALEKIEQELRV